MTITITINEALQAYIDPLTPVGHFKFPHLWPPKFPQAGRADYQLTEVFCARRAAASFSL